MYKLVFASMIMLAILSACSKENISFGKFLDDQESICLFSKDACTTATDAYIFPKNWTGEDISNFEKLPEETFSSMSTCGLVITLLEHPKNRMLGPFGMEFSDSSLPGVTMFNNYVRNNKVTSELFQRDDCFSLLASRYQIVIEENREISGQILYLEMLLSSDMCMSVMNKKEKYLLMEMALQRKEHKNSRSSCTPHIMISIMRSCNYKPFIDDVYPKLVEGTWGYSNLDSFDIKKYAKQFLNDRK